MIEVTAAIICKEGKFLICQRPKGKNCELLWESPGGKLSPAKPEKNTFSYYIRNAVNLIRNV